jgi:hypothetical protein
MVGTGRSVLSFSQELGLGHLLTGKLRMVRRTVLSFSQQLELVTSSQESLSMAGQTVITFCKQLELGDLLPERG